MHVVVVMLEDFMEKHAESMFLPVVETVIEGLGRIRDLFQFGTACRKVFRAEPKAFDQVAFLVMLLGLFVPFGGARSNSVANFSWRLSGI